MRTMSQQQLLFHNNGQAGPYEAIVSQSSPVHPLDSAGPRTSSELTGHQLSEVSPYRTHGFQLQHALNQQQFVAPSPSQPALGYGTAQVPHHQPNISVSSFIQSMPSAVPQQESAQSAEFMALREISEHLEAKLQTV